MRHKVLGLQNALFISIAAALLTATALLPGCGGPSRRKVSMKPYDIAGLFQRLKATTEKVVSVACAGDVNFGDGVTPSLSSGGVDYPWADASEVFSLADLSFVNLECCLSTAGSPVAGKEFCFRGPPDAAEGMKRAGLSVVSLANNHAKDYGTAAFLETLDHLKANGIAWCGAGRNDAEAYSPAVLKSHGRKVGFVAFTWVVPHGWPATATNPGCATTWSRDRVAGTIKEAKAGCDYVVASFHWGIELATSPNEEQRALAHLAVDSGADLVLGHHPHVVQGFELYGNRLIAYSLGNFIFSPPREISAKTMSVVAALGPKGLVQARVVPMVISGCRPLILNGGPADSWMGTVAGYSRGLGTAVSVVGGRGFINGSAPAPAK